MIMPDEDEKDHSDLVPTPEDDKVVEEEESEEGKVTLPQVGKDEQLLVAGAGTGTTLSLLGLALRRRLLGTPL